MQTDNNLFRTHFGHHNWDLRLTCDLQNNEFVPPLKTWTWTCHTDDACFPDSCLFFTVSSHPASSHKWQIYSLSYPLGCSQEEEAHFCCDLHPWFIFCLRTSGHRCTSDVITPRLFAYRAAVPSKLTSEWPGGSYGSSCQSRADENGLDSSWITSVRVSAVVIEWPAAMCHTGLRYCWHLTSDPVF